MGLSGADSLENVPLYILGINGKSKKYDLYVNNMQHMNKMKALLGGVLDLLCYKINYAITIMTNPMTEKFKYILSPATIDAYFKLGIDISSDIYAVLSWIREEEPSKYIVRKEGGFITQVYGDEKKQRLYGTYQSYTAQLGAGLLALCPDGSQFQCLMDFCSLRRHEIASINGQAHHPVGMIRSYSMQTTLDGPYQPVEERFKIMINDLGSKIYTDRRFKKISHLRISNIFELDGKSYTGNTFNYNKYNLPDCVSYIKHSDEKLPIDYCQNLLNQGMKAGTLDELHAVSAEIFWIICAFKPFELGDPSIAESIIRSLYFYKGYEMPAWKRGIIPWVEATLCFDIPSFKDIFRGLLDGPYKSLMTRPDWTKISTPAIDSYASNQNVKSQGLIIGAEDILQWFNLYPSNTKEIWESFLRIRKNFHFPETEVFKVIDVHCGPYCTYFPSLLVVDKLLFEKYVENMQVLEPPSFKDRNKFWLCNNWDKFLKFKKYLDGAIVSILGDEDLFSKLITHEAILNELKSLYPEYSEQLDDKFDKIKNEYKFSP